MWGQGVKNRGRSPNHRVQGPVHRRDVAVGGARAKKLYLTWSEGTGEWEPQASIPGASLLGGEKPRGCGMISLVSWK